MPKERQNISIRIPKDLLKKVDSDAEASERSRSQQIIYMLNGLYREADAADAYAPMRGRERTIAT